MQHELFLILRQTTKIGNAFPNNMSTDIKLTKAQTSKIIQSGVSWLAVLDTKALKNVAIPLTRDNLPRLVSNLASNVINTFERKINGKEL